MRKRMASIFLRGEIWWISFYPHPGSKPIQRSLKTKDKTVAKYKKNEIENQLAKGDSPIPHFNVNPSSILGEYKESCKHKNRERTIQDDSKRIADFLSWASVSRIKNIDEQLVKTYLTQRLDAEEINLNTANHIIANLKTFLNYAIRRNYIAANPLKALPKYRVDRLPPRFLSKSEVAGILAAARGEIIFPMIAAALYTGMRFGELLALKWEDVDFARDQIRVARSKSRTFRVIPLHKDLKKILIKGKGRPDQTCFDYQNKRRIFKRMKKRARVPEIGWHTFRHTFASHLIMSGVDIVTVSKLLGHADISTTMIYSHLSHGHIQQSIKSLTF
jgi:integrase